MTAWCVVLRMQWPGPLGSCSPVCPRSVLCRVFGSLATWVVFTGVPAWCVALLVLCPGPLGSCSPVCPLGVLRCVSGVLAHLAPLHRCACSVCCVARAVSWTTWLRFTSVPARCVVLRVRCPGQLGFCSPACPLRPLLCLCGVLDHLAPVHRCARLVCCVASTVSWATWLLFAGVPAWFVVLHVRCPGPLGSCSPVCPLDVLCCACGVLGHLAPVHRCARSVRCVGCAVSWTTWLLFTHLPAPSGALLMRCPGPLAPVHRCACLVRCVARAVSWATWLLFTGVPAWFIVLHVRCPVPLGSCSRCARSMCSVECAVCWATWLLFTGVPASFVVLSVRCPGPLGSCSLVCSPVALC